MSILIMLGLISFLIIAHELGHLFVARWCGVRVERFGFGLPFGPTLWSKKVGDTELCLHAVPLGGYVSFPDDSPESTVPMDSPERFENQPLFNRAAIALAGITVNAILAIVLMAGTLFVWGIPSMEVYNQAPLSILHTQTVDNRVALPATLKAQLAENQPVWAINDAPVTGREPLGYLLSMTRQPNRLMALDLYSQAGPEMVQTHWWPSPAARAGLWGGEKIVAVNEHPVTGYFQQPLDFVVSSIKQSPGDPISLTVETLAGQTKTVTLTPNEEGRIGIQLTYLEKRYPSPGLVMATKQSVSILSHIVVKNFEAMGLMMMGQVDPSQLAGPIKIVETGAKLIDQDGIEKGLILTATISMILAVMNLLPIPPLDGSHLIFITIEAILGRPVQKIVQERIIQVGFLGLMGLMICVIFNDIKNTFF